jgi:hypothetical protein
MAGQRTAVTRTVLAGNLVRLLKQRHEAFQAGQAVPPLHPGEEAALRRAEAEDATGNIFSASFWRFFEAEHGLTRGPVRLQHIGRTENYTVKNCTEFLAALDRVLQDMGFLIIKGPRKGYIADDSEWDWS